MSTSDIAAPPAGPQAQGSLSATPPIAAAPPRDRRRTNYLFVDWENVQEADWDRIAGKPVQVTLVLGARQKSLPVGLVRQLLRYASQVNLVEAGQDGRNALDLILAHHIGARRADDPHGYYHILSRDKDFDALIKHLKENGTLAARHSAFSEIPVLMNLKERVSLLTDHYKDKPATRPKKRRAIESQMQALFGKALSPTEIAETVQALVEEKAIAITEKDEVIYTP